MTYRIDIAQFTCIYCSYSPDGLGVANAISLRKREIWLRGRFRIEPDRLALIEKQHTLRGVVLRDLQSAAFNQLGQSGPFYVPSSPTRTNSITYDAQDWQLRRS
jgi:hypothetical protein